MSAYQEARDYGETVVTVNISETMGRCPKCRRPGLDAVWRKLRDGSVQCWAECRECGGPVVAGGSLPKGSGPMEVETRILERIQGARA